MLHSRLLRFYTRHTMRSRGNMSKSAYLSNQALPTALRWLALVAALWAPVAHADEYAEVNTLVRAGQLAEAMTKADKYLTAKPRDPQMRFLKGVIQTEAGKPNDAITTFTKITQDYPELPEPYNNLAVLYAGQNQFDKARAALEMAIRTNPSYATAHENLGDVYAKLASQAYSKALQLDGGNSAVQPKLALIRTLFTPESKAQKPAAATPAAPVTAQTPAAPPKPAAATPAAPAPAAPATPAAPAPAAPAAPVSSPAPAAATPVSAAEKEVENAVRAWAGAWAAKDMAAYLAAYGKDFDTPGKQSRKAWEDERRSRIVGKSRISVKISDLSVDVKGSKATAKFRQDYSANALNISSRKTLDMTKAGERWLITRESTGG
jgi:Flp pilus assembly protein TadD